MRTVVHTLATVRGPSAIRIRQWYRPARPGGDIGAGCPCSQEGALWDPDTRGIEADLAVAVTRRHGDAAVDNGGHGAEAVRTADAGVVHAVVGLGRGDQGNGVETTSPRD